MSNASKMSENLTKQEITEPFEKIVEGVAGKIESKGSAKKVLEAVDVGPHSKT